MAKKVVEHIYHVRRGRCSSEKLNFYFFLIEKQKTLNKISSVSLGRRKGEGERIKANFNTTLSLKKMLLHDLLPAYLGFVAGTADPGLACRRPVCTLKLRSHMISHFLAFLKILCLAEIHSLLFEGRTLQIN